MTDGTGPAPTGPQAGAPASTASLGVRFAARLLDFLIVGIPAGIILGLVGLGMTATTGVNWGFSLVISLLWFGYFVYFESTMGATLGKRILNVRVVAADGSNPSMEAAAKRNAWMLLGLIPWIGGLLNLVAVIVIAATITSNEHNRGKHDEFAGTGVIV